MLPLPFSQINILLFLKFTISLINLTQTLISIDIKLKFYIYSNTEQKTPQMKQHSIHMLPQNDANQDTVKKIQHYLFNWSDRIGKGSFSDVYLGINELNQQPVAIKLIKNQSLKSKTAQRLLNHQISILKYLDHPNVIKCHDVFTSLNHCYIITEYCPQGDVQKILKKRKFFQEQQISKIIYDVYKGLQYLNDNLIIHRDIKIANIFFTGSSYKIADFGFAIRSKTLFTDIPVGSPIYMSPEGLIGNNYGPKTDVWSFGVMLYQLLHGEAPLDKCQTQEELKLNVIKKPQIKPNISPQLIALILSCLEPNLSKRISVSQIKQTLYMKRVIQLYEKQIVPEKLTSTHHSTETSYSVFQSPFDRSFTQEEALSILHYCRLLHKTSIKTANREFALWLLLIFEGFSRCKITRMPNQKSPKNDNKSQYQNLKQVILQYHQKYKNEHSSTILNLNDKPSFDSILFQCTKLYKECEPKSLLNNELKNAVFNLYKETELLNQSFKSNKIDYFAKHSQSKEFLSALGKATVQ